MRVRACWEAGRPFRNSRRQDVSPGNRPAEIVEILEAACSILGLNDFDQVRDALLYAQSRRRAAHVGAHPTWR